MKKELVDPGKVYQEQMKHCGHSSVMIHPELLVYLKSSELVFWIEVCRRANMTKFPDGTFIAEIGDMARSVCMKERHAKDMLSSLVEIGFMKRYRKKGYRYEISYSSITTLLNVLDCSADELLCREIKAGKPVCYNWLTTLIEDCDPTETKILSDTLICLKASLRKNKTTE